MSCRDYLKNKLSGLQKVVNVQKPTDASMMTLKKKHAASRVFAFDGGEVGTTRVASDMTAEKLNLPTSNKSFKKGSCAPPDASFYTAYRGAQGIDNDAAYRNGGRKVIPCNPNLNSSYWSYPSASDRGRQLKTCANTNGLKKGYPLYAGEPLRKLPNGYNDNANLVGTLCNTTYARVMRGSKNLIKVYVPISKHTTKDFFMKAPPLFQSLGVDSVKVGNWVASKSVSFPYVENHHGNANLDHKFAYTGRKGLPSIYGNWVVAKINRATLFNIKSPQQINAVYW
jgi:hypothetical protein